MVLLAPPDNSFSNCDVNNRLTIYYGRELRSKTSNSYKSSHIVLKSLAACRTFGAEAKIRSFENRFWLIWE